MKTIMFLGLLAVVIAASSSPLPTLRTIWLANRKEPQPVQALLFESCILSADGGTILNGYVCDNDTASLVIGCLNIHHAYACSLNSGKWVQLNSQ